MLMFWMEECKVEYYKDRAVEHRYMQGSQHKMHWYHRTWMEALPTCCWDEIDSIIWHVCHECWWGSIHRDNFVISLDNIWHTWMLISAFALTGWSCHMSALKDDGLFWKMLEPWRNGCYFPLSRYRNFIIWVHIDYSEGDMLLDHPESLVLLPYMHWCKFMPILLVISNA